jgi:Fur family ferric uptake transcriptional regulator
MKKSVTAKSSTRTAARFHAMAEAQLRDSRIRVTDARVKVLAALLGAPYAFSHQDVQDTLADMDRVTLYRALDCLTDAGLAHKIAGDDRVYRYNAAAEPHEHGDKTAAQHQHGHFKCTRCARVFCIENVDASTDAALRKELQSALRATLGKGFRSQDIELTIKGLCADCAH